METGEFKALYEALPHDEIMDILGLSFDDLNPEIQRDIRAFDALYTEASVDVDISDEEEKEIITASYKIAQRIKKEYGTDNSDVAVGIFSILALSVAAFFGVKQLTK